MPEVVNLRWMHEAHPESVRPVHVLDDDGSAIVTWEPGTTAGMHTLRPLGGPRGRNLEPGTPHTGYAHREWTGDGVLRVHRRGQPWSTWRWLSTDRTWSGVWYVNLEEPWVRRGAGYDTEDWILDVVADAAGGWQYKDEDELEWAEASGRFTNDEVDRVRRAGVDAIAVVESRAWPFDADWQAWLPPLDLPVPTLQPGWDDAR